MSLYPNPFEARASEQQRDIYQFVYTFGAGAIDLLPMEVWDRLVILRSSPGAGKTSLMRLFATETLLWIRDRYDTNEPVSRLLTERGVLGSNGKPLKLGVLVSLDRDYKSLADLPIDSLSQDRLFLRLLDSRIFASVVRAALISKALAFSSDAAQFHFDTEQAEASTQVALERFGGIDGVSILEYATRTEREVLSLLDALLNVDMEDRVEGHAELLSLAVLEECPIRVHNETLELAPLLMFDDGHEITPRQRELLLDNLRRRRPGVARWYAERFEAMSDLEVLQGMGSHKRDHIYVDIDRIARNGEGRRFTANQHQKILSHVAVRRAAPVLSTYAHETQPLFELFEDPEDAPLPPDFSASLTSLQSRVLQLAGEDVRYSHWLVQAESLSALDSAVYWRELEVLITRDKGRHPELFSTPLTISELTQRSNASIREAAQLAIAHEFGLPYYAGESRLVTLGSHNIEQFLKLCGSLFEDLLVDVSLGRQPKLSAVRQDQLVQQASRDYWDSIPRTVPNGRDVRALVVEIVRIAMEENKKPTMPYPPGVTGTAILMAERDQLLDTEYRRRMPAAERLFSALAAAVAYNVVAADLDYSVKNDRFMVLYLNRLLCPLFGLPLGRGAFRERKLSQMLGWLQGLPESGHREPLENEPSLEL